VLAYAAVLGADQVLLAEVLPLVEGEIVAAWGVEGGD
jgi:hypothetical protein